MKKVFLLTILFTSLFYLPSMAAGIVPSELLSDNEYLITRSRKLMDQAREKIIEGRVDSSFSNGLIRGLADISKAAFLRQTILRKINQENTEPISRRSIRRSQQYVQNNNKVVLRTIQQALDTDHLLCDVSKRVLAMVSAFKANKKAYFAPGKYLIPYSIRPKANAVYRPMLDSIKALAEDYPELNFEGLIRTTGYSDATPTPRGSVLYNDMVQRMQYEPLEMEEINQYLSYLRSYDLSDLIRGMVKQQKLRFVKIKYDRQGMGSKLPDANLRYTRNDDRRRVVTLYWHILPKF